MEPKRQPTLACAFVAEVIKRCNNEKETAYRAAMRRADNPDTETFAWEYLTHWCDIARDYERIPFALIGAAVAREKPAENGKKDLGELFRCCCKDENDSEREKRRFHRIISCDSTLELCDVLRSNLKYLQGKVPGEIDYARLLEDILYFGNKVKLRWAGNFFGKKESNEGDKNDSD